MKPYKYPLLCLLVLPLTISCTNQDVLTMSEEEFLRATATNKDYNVQTSNFSSTYVIEDDLSKFGGLGSQIKTVGSYLATTDKDEDGYFTYTSRINKDNSFKSLNEISSFKINSTSNAGAYFDNTDYIIYDALGKSMPIGDSIDNSCEEYVIIIAGDTDLYEAINGVRGDKELHIFDLAYITAQGEVKGLLYKLEGDSEYLLPHSSLLPYIDKINSIRYQYNVVFNKQDDGTYRSSSYIYYYDYAVSFTHVSRRAIEQEEAIDTSLVEGNVAFNIVFNNEHNILYTYELITSITNDYDFFINDSRYKIHTYTNQVKEKQYQEVNNFPKLYFVNIAYSKDENKCAILCHEINKDKTIDNEYSTIAFDNNYRYGTFTSELGIFSGEENYIQFGEDYYSYHAKDYSLYMYRSDDFAVLKGKASADLDHSYLVVNNKSNTTKIFSTNISSLSTKHHIIYYSTSKKDNLQFNILNTENMSTNVISDVDKSKKLIASLEYGLYWDLTGENPTLKDFMGNPIYEEAKTACYFYEQTGGYRTILLGHAYNFYVFYGSDKYEPTAEGVHFTSVYYLTNQTK